MFMSASLYPVQGFVSRAKSMVIYQTADVYILTFSPYPLVSHY